MWLSVRARERLNLKESGFGDWAPLKSIPKRLLAWSLWEHQDTGRSIRRAAQEEGNEK